MAPVDRPHNIVGRLTASQYRLLKDKIERERHMSIQKLISACVNAYVRGDFVVTKSGGYTIGDPSAVSEGDDPDAIDLDSIHAPDPDPFNDEAPVARWGTSDVASYVEKRTGRRVSKQLLRVLIRERYPQPDMDDLEGPARRYYWMTNDPTLKDIINDVVAGALEEIREARIGPYKQ